MFCKMDPSGNGYVDLPEFEAYLRKYQMSLGSQRSGYLFSVIHSMNAELKEGGSVPHGKKILFWFRFRSSRSHNVSLYVAPLQPKVFSGLSFFSLSL